jgi:hypothetical protein
MEIFRPIPPYVIFLTDITRLTSGKSQAGFEGFFRTVFFLPVAFTVYFYLGTIAVSSRFDKSTTEE